MFRKRTMKAALLCLACSAFTPSFAQVYLQDYTSLHIDPNDKQWVRQDAVYRDDNNDKKVYYIAQGLRPRDKDETFLGITMCDVDMNVIVTWEYFNEAYSMDIKTEQMDEMTDLKALVLVGHYRSGDISSPFVMSVDKYSGAVNWFQLFPELELTSLKAANDYVLVTGRKPLPDRDGIYGFSASSGIIMRLDKDGNLVWEREFEDDKYASSEYEVKEIHNSMNDIVRFNEKHFVAIGSTNRFVYKEQPDNLWDSDGMLVVIDPDGNVNTSVMLGNTLPMSPNGQQAIQYEEMYHLTVDEDDATVVITGERLDNKQSYVSDKYPTPERWGLWATKIDPYSLGVSWTHRYQFRDDYYRITDPEIDWDRKEQYGISYNFYLGSDLPIVMKLDNGGGVVYHRYHTVSDANGRRALNDITRAFEYNNMTTVGFVEPDVDQYRSSWGWNVQAFDNILEYCETKPLDVEPERVKFRIDKVEYRKYKVHQQEEKLVEEKIELVNKVICDKKLVAKKSSSTDDNISTKVMQDIDSRSVVIEVSKTNLATGNTGDFKAVLYNALGQRLLETSTFSNSYRLSTGDLAAGIYYLQVTNGSFSQSHTISVR